ncbi:helix-turn-helix transcriptional regulator [Mucilaginibacter flavus]|uniref:helix-turn-helix transcriptional regulator n=1 Tax=Mucilaginibacter flavus TaxID=931504 RepID=UPI00338E85D7
MPVRTFLSRSASFKKPNVPQYTNDPKTIGEHIRKKRIQSNCAQKELADKLGVSENTINAWELGHTNPSTHYYPAIIAYLGYYPFEHETESCAGKLKQIRHCKGLTFEQCATLFSISEDAAMRWEKGKTIANETYKERIRFVWSELPEHLVQHPL